MCLAKNTLPKAPLPNVDIMSKLEKFTLLFFVISLSSLVSSYFFAAFPFLTESFVSCDSLLFFSSYEGFL